MRWPNVTPIAPTTTDARPTNVLVGGFDKSITLQPVSVEGDKGLNVAAGIASITLHAAP